MSKGKRGVTYYVMVGMCLTKKCSTYLKKKQEGNVDATFTEI